MNLLIISRPGIRIYHELRKSETAWYALRFYDPIEIPIGIYVLINSLSAALCLASDLKYFIRKYGAEYLLEIKPGLFCTAQVAKSRYLTREDLPSPWPWKLFFHVDNKGLLQRFSTLPENGFPIKDGKTKGDYLITVLCSEEEFSVSHYV